MIVVCEHCNTRFRLDDARIPARGARVRCSRCKTSFFVASPSASEGEALEDVARAAAAGGRTPEPAGDLSDPTLVVPARPGGRDDEQWEFDDEAGGAAPAPARDEEPSLGEPDTVIGEESGLESLGDADLEAVLGDAEAARAQLGFGEGGELGEGSEVEAAAPTQPRPGPASAPATAPPAGREAAPSADASGDFDLEGLGNPDEWSFVPDGPGGEVAAPPGVEAHDDDPFGLDEADAEGTRPAAQAEESGAAKTSARAARLGGRIRLGSAPAAVAWLASCALTLLGVALAATPRPVVTPPPAPTQRVELAGGEARDVRGRFVENAVGGRTFVVSGVLSAVLRPVELRVEWLDAAGQVLAGSALAGPALPTAQLRERAPEALRAELAAEAGQLARGGRFDAVLPDPPEGASGFQLRLAPRAPTPAPGPAGEAPDAAEGEAAGPTGADVAAGTTPAGAGPGGP